jgi:hypothetical protein
MTGTPQEVYEEAWEIMELTHPLFLGPHCNQTSWIFNMDQALLHFFVPQLKEFPKSWVKDNSCAQDINRDKEGDRGTDRDS